MPSIKAILAAIFVIGLAACKTNGVPEIITTSETTSGAPIGGPLIEELEARGLNPLGTEALEELHVGHTLLHTNLADGMEASITYHADGTRDIKFLGKTVSNNYEITDNTRCEFSVNGPLICVVIYEMDDHYYGCDSRDGGVCDWLITKVD
jgi:hypothetical protein